jgi:hypothetical protein
MSRNDENPKPEEAACVNLPEARSPAQDLESLLYEATQPRASKLSPNGGNIQVSQPLVNRPFADMLRT